jgi:hypothetical protein
MTTLRNIGVPSLLLVLAAAVPACASAEWVEETVPHATALGSGPFKAVPAMDAGLPRRTIYAPPDLSVLGGRKLPIVAWGNGACQDNGTRYRWFLSEVASRGYLVLANGSIGPLEEDLWQPQPLGPARMPDLAELRPGPTSPAQLIESIDWAIAENERPGSRYFGRIDTANIAVMGMSCGGVQAIEAGMDPRVDTTVVWNSGLFDDPRMNATAGGKALTRADLARLHGAVAYISGDESDAAFVNANSDFALLPEVPALRAWRKDTPHDGTYGEVNGGEFGKVGVAWLDWRLKGDEDSARMFVGAECGLCRDPDWTVRQKNLR